MECLILTWQHLQRIFLDLMRTMLPASSKLTQVVQQELEDQMTVPEKIYLPGLTHLSSESQFTRSSKCCMTITTLILKWQVPHHHHHVEEQVGQPQLPAGQQGPRQP